MTVTVKTLTGAALSDAADALARLRIAVFHDFPYLYEGTLDYEARYLQIFLQAKDAIIVAAQEDDGRIVGCATGTALGGHHGELAKPFIAAGYDIDQIFYCSESVLLDAYRGRGLGHAFFDQREAHARTRGYKYSTFCGVVRPDDHPLKPADYRPLDAFWHKRGYRKLEGIVAEFEWRDIGDDKSTRKPMQFWMKAL